MQANPLSRLAFYSPQAGICHSNNAFILEELRQRLGNVLIFAVHQAIIPFHDGDATAQAPHGLGEFQTDVAAAKNQQMFRYNVEFQRFHMREGRGFSQTRYVTDVRSGPRVDEDLLAVDNAFPSPWQ